MTNKKKMAAAALRAPYCAEDGFGEQYKMILLTMFFAEQHGFQFVYETPQAMQHNYNNDPHFIRRKEEIWNLEQYRAKQPSALSVSVPDLLHFWEQNIDKVASSRNLQKAQELCHMANDHFAPFRDKTLVLHVRRPNAHDFGVKSFEVPISVYDEIIRYLLVRYPYHQFIMVSQGETKEPFFEHMQTKFPMMKLSLLDDTETAFRKLLYADVLVMAPSALSYVAGLMRPSEKTNYYIQHCNPPLPHWLRIFGYVSERRHYEYLYKMSVFFDASQNRFFAGANMPPQYQRVFQEVALSLPPIPANPSSWPFNGNPEFGDYVKMWFERFQVRHVIETGTFLGQTTAFFAKLPALEQIHSIEINPDYLAKARNRLAEYVKVHLYAGNSPDILPEILKTMPNQGLIAFYLDAHWNEYLPLFAEMKVMAEHLPNRCFVMIDDVLVPERPDIPFDSYQGQPFSVDFVKTGLEAIFPAGYHLEIYAPPPRLAKTRGRLIAWPRH